MSIFVDFFPLSKPAMNNNQILSEDKTSTGIRTPGGLELVSIRIALDSPHMYRTPPRPVLDVIGAS